MSFGFFAVGCLFLLAGVSYLAHLMQLPQVYIMGCVLIAIGVAAVTRAQSDRRSRV
jgi:hypothetical protein